MQKTSGLNRFSATDLVNFAACAHLTHLDLVNLESPLPKAADSEEMVLIQEKGFEHEARYWQHLKSAHPNALDLSDAGSTDETKFAATVQAIHQGADVVFQATLLEEPWVGHADFLMRVERPSNLGQFSYEVADTKLARTSRAKFLVQLCLYSEMLARVQGVMPQHMHVVLGDGRKETFIVDDYLRYFRRLQTRFLEWARLPERATYPEKVERCGQCRWREICTQRWEDDDHLNRVANIQKIQIGRLHGAGVSTLAKLATLPAEQAVRRIQPKTLERLIQQARLQQESLLSGEPIFELLPLVASKGFARMPAPADGDLFFDMEGNPMEDGGLEYLFGVYFFEDGKPVFKPFWAHSRHEERLAFEAFIDFVMEHLRRFPQAHVYHYAPYEVTALKRLMSLHGTRESEVDNLLRYGKFIDLYAVVREAIRVGEASYSIKAIERFYSSKQRAGDVTTAGASIVFYEKWKATQDAEILQAIADYNEDDVRSTFELRQWLLSICPAEAVKAASLGEIAPQLEQNLSPRAVKASEKVEEYRRQLLNGLPAERLDWTREHQVRELLFQLLGFHRRSEKPAWWSLFARKDASEDELLNDLEALAGLERSRTPQQVGEYLRYWYRCPAQESKLRTGSRATVTETMEEVLDLVVNEETSEVQFDKEADGPELATLNRTGIRGGCLV